MVKGLKINLMKNGFKNLCIFSQQKVQLKGHVTVVLKYLKNCHREKKVNSPSISHKAQS